MQTKKMAAVIKAPLHLLVCLSAHGYGHFAMTAPILNALRQKHNFQLTLRTTLPKALLKTRIDGEFTVIADTSDFGMVMHNSFDVNIEASAACYSEFHQDYALKVEEESASLRAIKPDFILANIPYLTIDAAYACNIPCIAYCSLNWLEVFTHYFTSILAEEAQIKKQITDAYNRAAVFMCPAPSMPMPLLHNVRAIGPVARVFEGKAQTARANLCEYINAPDLGKQTKIVLVTPGGVSTHIPVENWPKEKHIIWLCSWPLTVSRQDVISTANIPLLFNDIMAGCDAVVSKPGYGIVSETVCNQIPVLYIKRGDWPEEPHLIKWWRANGIVDEVSRTALEKGQLVNNLKSLWLRDEKKKVYPSGIDDACEIILSYMKK